MYHTWPGAAFLMVKMSMIPDICGISLVEIIMGRKETGTR
jgi:hypothetical protein